jgi:hypothetical protein
MAVVSRASLNVVASDNVVHKGHGGSGESTTLTATLQATASAFVSPMGGTVVPIHGTGQAAGIDVTWYPNPTMESHGVTSSTNTTTNPGGQATLTYTANTENPRADRSGYLVKETGTVEAFVSGVDLITQLYGEPALGALMPNIVRGSVQVDVEWHAPRLMHIEVTNTYNVTINAGAMGQMEGSGTDTFIGDLDEQEDGTWRGTVNGTATGSHSGFAFNQQRCSSSWNAYQGLEVIGEPAPNALSGDFIFRFTPIADPLGNTGRGRCPPQRWKDHGIYYAPFNDYAISHGALGQGLVIILPQKPGGERDYPVPTMPPGSGFGVNANWHVKIEFFEPVP